ncbi:uncharacterized protein LOC119912078 isoform X5 [Scomber scombrus]|uniref:Uncharacterized protein LOC119912078 isoform X5 n=1 Tax=Scomber scombrus TaxID=13677 RepID=A0AAV1P6E8_SCOSC
MIPIIPRIVNGTKLVCISIMAKYDSQPHYCDGFQSGRFELSTNLSTVFLTIKQVNFSDSGLYFWGFYKRGYPVFSEIRLDFEEVSCDGIAALPSVILHGLSVVLITVLIILVVKTLKFKTAADACSVLWERDWSISLLCDRFVLVRSSVLVCTCTGLLSHRTATLQLTRLFEI